eukprot:scaffold48_cov311-Pinguiococcus_pyrenoidosus.AAC.21
MRQILRSVRTVELAARRTQLCGSLRHFSAPKVPPPQTVRRCAASRVGGSANDVASCAAFAGRAGAQ